MSIRDDIDKLGASSSDTAKGQCAKCGDENPYSSIACSGCGARLPWADAVSDKARATASTHAPLSIASARATVNPPSGSSSPGAGSRGPIVPAVATVLLIAGGLIGAAVVVPNFISRSATVQPTPVTEMQTPRSVQAAPSSTPAFQAPVTPAPQDTAAGMGGVLVRDDVEIRVNSSREAAVLTTSGPSHLEEPVAPAPGKTFLIVNVTVNFKGGVSLQVAESMLRLTASNKQFYMGGLHKWLDNPTNYTLLMADLAPGGSAKGDVIYEVEPGLKVEKLEFIDARPQSYKR